MEYKVMYKLTVVGVDVDDKGFRHGESEVCCIGHFHNEEKLRRWAERNDGELAKENKN